MGLLTPLVANAGAAAIDQRRHSQSNLREACRAIRCGLARVGWCESKNCGCGRCADGAGPAGEACVPGRAAGGTGLHHYAGRRSISTFAVVGVLWALFSPSCSDCGRSCRNSRRERRRRGGDRSCSSPFYRWAGRHGRRRLITGAIAMDRIRKSKCRLYGLSLALFDALFFPLLGLDFMVFWICWVISQQMTDFPRQAAARHRSSFHRYCPRRFAYWGIIFL